MKLVKRTNNSEKKHVSKEELSKREKVYSDMLSYQKSKLKEEKVCPTDSAISLINLNKIYPNRVQAVYNFNLEIKDKEFIVLVGPSGCGKSTTLRMIAGLEEITAGDLYIDGVFANELEPKDRDVAMVFQSYALYPHMSVYENLAFGLEVRKLPKAEIDERVQEAAAMLEIENFLERKPKALSGGQKQRVALGRAIVRHSRIFLMDEPLSNLDAKLRVQMRSEIVNLHARLGTTTVYVTHDQTEAMTMATRIVVMKQGYIQQIGTPREIYNHPANTFVANFIGAPAMNIVSATFDVDKVVFENGYTIQLDPKVLAAHQQFYKTQKALCESKIAEITAEIESLKQSEKVSQYLLSYNEQELDSWIKKKDEYEKYAKSKSHPLLFGIRPEDIIQEGFVLRENNLSSLIDIKLSNAELLGNEYYVHTLFGGKKIIAKINANQVLNINDHIKVAFNLDKMHLFDPISELIII